MLVAFLAAGFAVFRAAGSLRFGVARRTILLRGAGCEKHRGRSDQNSGKTDHVGSDVSLAMPPQGRQVIYLLGITGGGGGGGGVCWQELRTAEAAMRVRIAIFMCVWVLTSLLVPHPPDSWQRDF